MGARPFVIPTLYASGSPVSGAKVYSYVKGTTTLQALYTDEGLTTPAANPFVADSEGRVVLYMDDTLNYTITIKSADDASTFYSVDYSAEEVSVTESQIRTRLTGARVFYVNHATGSDGNSGSASSPWATITYAYAWIRDNIDFAGQRAEILVASGTFDESILCYGPLTGIENHGGLTITGDTTTPSNCYNNYSGTGPAFSAFAFADVRLQGMKLANASGTDHCVKSWTSARIELGMIEFGDCALRCVQSADGWVNVKSRFGIAGQIKFDGNSQGGLLCEVGDGGIDITGATVEFGASVTFSGAIGSAFLTCGEGAYFACYDVTWTGTFTGRKYLVSNNAAAVSIDLLENIPGSLEGRWKSPKLSTPQGRLTLTNGTPVTTADVTAATTIHYEPYIGDFVPVSVNREAVYEMLTIGASGLQLQLSASDHLVDTNYDVVIFRTNDTTGPVVLGTLPAWSGNQTRSAALSAANGIMSNTASVTAVYNDGTNSGSKTLNAGEAVYLGTIRCTANGQTEDSIAKRFVWNMYNRRERAMRVTISGTWTYSTAAYRVMGGSSANALAMVRGIDEDLVDASVHVTGRNSSGNAQVAVGVGVGNTTLSDDSVGDYHVVGSGAYRSFSAAYRGAPGIGYRLINPLEYGAGTGTQTWGGTGVSNDGIVGKVAA